MKKTALIIGIVLLAIIASAFTVSYYKAPSTSLGGGFGEKGAFASTTTYTIAQTSVTVLPARGGRAFTIFSNSSSNDMWIRLDGTAATVNNGIYLKASTTLTLSDASAYRGVVTAISAAGSNPLGITEGIYNN